MPADEKHSVTTQVYEVYIKATPQAIWDAITYPEWTAKYGYRGPARLRAASGRRVSGARDAANAGDGAAGRRRRRRGRSKPSRRNKLVHTYRFLFTDAQSKAEGFTRVTWEIEEAAKPVSTRLTVTHELEGAPFMAARSRASSRSTAAVDGPGSSATSSRCWRPARP